LGLGRSPIFSFPDLPILSMAPERMHFFSLNHFEIPFAKVLAFLLKLKRLYYGILPQVTTPAKETIPQKHGRT
jgi:hypothetical protein